MNQFRRDPITGHWSIVVQDDFKIDNLLSQTEVRRTTDQKTKDSRFCSGRESETAPEIYAIRGAGSQRNEPGWKVRVLPNNEPFLQIHGDLNNRGVGFYDVLDGIGAHELIVEAPVNGETIHDMSLEQIQNILSAYRERILDLKRDTRFRYVLVHKSYGEGQEELKNHSHSHIIATPITPALVKAELMQAREHFKYKERCLFCDILNQEMTDGERLINHNDKYAAFSPFASKAPFEVWIMPKNHETFFEWNSEYGHLAKLLKDILTRIKTSLKDPNFVMVLHTGPNISAGRQRGYWKTVERDYHWHIEITPRFRGYTSFYIGSGFQINVIAPERAAEILKKA
jgi:UDPglucose--hexose-1-phosphate uridylyltransferase